MAQQRDLNKEQAMIGEYVSKFGKPQSSQDWANFHQMVYGADVPQELVNQTGIQPQSASGNPASNVINGQPSLSTLYSNMQQAKEGYQAVSTPNIGIQVLQNALKKKVGVDTMGIGESETFKKAKVGGIGALTSSLNARRGEIQNDQVMMNNIIQGISSVYKDMAVAAKNLYDMEVEQYNNALKQIQASEQSLTEHKQALERLKYASELDKENEAYKASLEAGQIDLTTGKPIGKYALQTQTTSKLGEGVITGLGSDKWKPGLDYVINGGDNAEITIPDDFTLLEVIPEDKSGGFGNQVRILWNGQEVWLSHLSSVNEDLKKVSAGNMNQRYTGGTSIGTQGNTGNTYSLTGGTGAHVDITMPKVKNPNMKNTDDFYTAEEVANFLGIQQTAANKKASYQEFTDQEKRKLDAAGLGDAGYEAQANFLYNSKNNLLRDPEKNPFNMEEYNEIKSLFEDSKEASNSQYVNENVYKNIMQEVQTYIDGGLKYFINQFPPSIYLDPNSSNYDYFTSLEM